MSSTGRLRWIIELSAYEYDIKHKSGQLHQNADSLSRIPVEEASPENKREENVFLMAELDTAPVSADEVRDWTSKDPILAKVHSEGMAR